jgi:hypothetical protein
MFPATLAMFSWYGLVAFYSVLGDLEERPWLGAGMWMIVVGVQIVAMAVAHRFVSAPIASLWGSCAGAGVGAILIGPAIFWRPVKLTAVAVPLGVFAIVPLTFLLPREWAWWVGVPAVVVGLVFLWSTRILIRPRDKRAVRRMREKRLRERPGFEVQQRI